MEGILAIIVGWVVVAAITGLFKNDGKNKDRDKSGNLFTGNFISQKQQENSVKQEVNDVNYCRSVAAQYGQQGTNEFSNAYNACMTGKGW